MYYSKKYKQLLIIFLILIATWLSAAEKNYILTEKSFSVGKAEYQFMPNKSFSDRNFGEQVLNFVIPSKEFDCKIAYSDGAKPDFTYNADYSGMIHGYHTVQVKINFAQNRKTDKTPLNIRFSFTNQPKSYRADLPTKDSYLENLTENFSSAKKFRQQSKSDLKTKNILPDGQEIFKLYVKEDGIYKLDSYELSRNGISLNGVDPRTIRLFNEGKELPVFVYGEGDHSFDNYDFIEFYGEKNLYRYQDQQPDRYLDTESEENVYYLTFGGQFGKRLVEENGGIIEDDQNKLFTPEFFRNKVHFEQERVRNQIRYLPALSEPDLWFYTYLDGLMNVNLPFMIKNIKNDSVQVKYSIIASPSREPSGSDNPDPYLLNMAVNSKNLPQTSWQGLYPFTDSAMVLASAALKEGDNILNISNPGSIDTRVYLNWFEVTYSSLFKADNNRLAFNQGGRNLNGEFYSPTGKLYDYKITGFTSNQLQLYKLGVSKIVNSVIQSVESNGSLTYTLHFQDQIAAPVNYLIITEEQKKIPVRIEKMRRFPQKLTSVENHAAYLIVTHKEFIDNPTLAEYLEHKNAQFGQDNIKVVDIEQVFDEFSNSEYSGDGLYHFLQYAAENWQQPPAFVNLIGTCGYNHRSAPGNDFIPLKTFQHYRHGAVVSDYFLSVADQNPESKYPPQFYIGRIPCADNSQLTANLKKVMTYEQPELLGINYTKRLRNLDIVSDSLDYHNYLDWVLPIKSKYEFSDRMLIWSNDEPYQGGTASLLDKFDRGLGMVNYFGHGSGEIWANSRLLLPQDVDRMATTAFSPIVYTWSCYGGNFPSKPTDSYSDLGLSEKMLFADKKGGTAIISASANSQFDYNFKIYAEVLKKQQEKVSTLGELFTLAKYQFYLPYSSMDDNQGKVNLYQYLLLGDPTLKLDYPAENGNLNVTGSHIGYQDSLKLGGFNALPAGQGILKLYNSGNHYVALSREEETVTSADISNGNISIVLPDSAACHFPDNPDNYLTAKLFWCSSDNKYSVDYTTAYLNNSSQPLNVLNLRCTPDKLYLTDQDSIALQAEIYSSKDIRTVKCYADTVQDGAPHYNLTFTAFTKMGATYTTKLKIPPLKRKSRCRFFFTAEDADSNIVTSDIKEIIVPYADLSHQEIKPAYQDSSRNRLAASVSLRFAVPQFAKIKYDNVQVDFYNIDQPDRPQLLGSGTVSLEISETKTSDTRICAIDYNFPSGLHNYKVVINPDHTFAEPYYNETNEISGLIKTNRFLVSVQNGSEINGLHAAVGVENITCEIPAGAISENAVLELDTCSIDKLPVQQDFLPVWLVNGQKFGLGYQLYSAAQTIAGKSAVISIKNLLIDNFTSDYKLCVYDPAGRKWRIVEAAFTAVKENSSRDEKGRARYDIEFSAESTGIYSVFRCSDKVVPSVEINAEGQIFSNNSYVSTSPKLIVMAQDLSGIDPASLVIRLDGRTLQLSEMQITDLNQANNSLQASITPALSPGNHLIEVTVRDNAGNQTVFSRSFSVADEFKVVYHGNYPNPFINETIFCYKLTQTARTVNLAIYTVSGRKIRNFRQENVINFAEIRWNGRDEDGELIANGVYFYKLTVDNGSKKSEVTGKMARLRK